MRNRTGQKIFLTVRTVNEWYIIFCKRNQTENSLSPNCAGGLRNQGTYKIFTQCVIRFKSLNEFVSCKSIKSAMRDTLILIYIICDTDFERTKSRAEWCRWCGTVYCISNLCAETDGTSALRPRCFALRNGFMLYMGHLSSTSDQGRRGWMSRTSQC